MKYAFFIPICFAIAAGVCTYIAYKILACFLIFCLLLITIYGIWLLQQIGYHVENMKKEDERRERPDHHLPG